MVNLTDIVETTSNIIYDLDELGELSGDDLLRQLIYRDDRHYPDAATKVDAAVKEEQVNELLNTIIEELREQGFPVQADQIEVIANG